MMHDTQPRTVAFVLTLISFGSFFIHRLYLGKLSICSELVPGLIVKLVSSGNKWLTFPLVNRLPMFEHLCDPNAV